MRLILIGGGHAHVEVLRQLRPGSASQVSLLSPDSQTAYSGMLPGVIAGRYRPEQMLLDLRHFCQAGGIRFLEGQASALDLDKKRVICSDGRELEFDYLSINVGSIPPQPGTRGLAVKPVSRFLEQLDGLLKASLGGDLVVVGGGPGGVELVLSLRSRTRRHHPGLRLHLVTASPDVLPGHSAMARWLCRRALQARGVRVHLGARVVEADGQLQLQGGQSLAYQGLIWATGARAPAWLAKSPLVTDPQGFVCVTADLQSISHPFVFAAGDADTLIERPCPKAGVFAVRQGPILAANLRALMGGDTPRRQLSPSRRYLSLLSYGDGTALASWGALGVQGRFWGRLKDWIDLRWMKKYQT